jgi:hypothetical protein
MHDGFFISSFNNIEEIEEIEAFEKFMKKNENLKI